jgi:hypothetical protein
MSPITGIEAAVMKERMETFLPDGKTLSVDMTCGVDFFPRIAWGEKESVGKSKIQRADRTIEIWEEVRRAHVERLPGAVPFIDEKLAEARAARVMLEDCEENHRVR